MGAGQGRGAAAAVGGSLSPAPSSLGGAIPILAASTTSLFRLKFRQGITALRNFVHAAPVASHSNNPPKRQKLSLTAPSLGTASSTDFCRCSCSPRI